MAQSIDIFPKILLIFRERGREGERERNTDVTEKKHCQVVSHICPDQGPNSKPSHVLRPAIELATFVLWDTVQPTEPYWAGQ